MSFIKFDQDSIETFSLVLNPQRTYSSGTLGVTGSVHLFARAPTGEKDIRPSQAFVDSFVRDQDLTILLDTARETAAGGSTNISGSIEAYMSGVHAQGQSSRKLQVANIYRFDPGVTYSKDFARKRIVRNSLIPYYRTTRPSYQYAYTNYNALNFFTSSQVPESSVILYPNLPSGNNGAYASGSYVLTGAFTFDFYVNPRYSSTDSSLPYNAGTIFHLSSCYAISLVTGSSKNVNGVPDGFRVLLQLSHSADVPPSQLLLASTPGTYPRDLAFMSADNSLKSNNWHHVAIRWGGSTVNDGTGSFVIDGQTSGEFSIPSASIAPFLFTSTSNPDALCIGNYYEGPNRLTGSLAYFFNTPAATDEGVINMLPAETQPTVSASFRHPLNAEVHELKIFDTFRTMDEITTSSMSGPKTLANLRFYVPPFFMKESPVRKILQTPFFSIQSSTDDPFNVAMSFGVDGHLINISNFTRDLVTLRAPRHLFMTASTIDVTVEAQTANEFLYATASVRRANLLLLPCDNGKFTPNFGLLTSGSYYGFHKSGSLYDKYTNDLGVIDPSLISLTDMIPSGNIRAAITADSGSMFSDVVGATPDNPGVDPGEVLTIFQRTHDNSSNEVVFFDVSNLFYGQRIMPGSVSITDGNLTGSGNRVQISLRDDGWGSLYRSNCLTPAATWNSVGNVFYEDGIIMVKSPHLAMFGKDNFSISFKGEHAVHTLKLITTAPAGMINSSSNPTYIPISASFDANDPDSKFVYITGLSFHDKDLNVVMRTALAQPAIKRSGDRLTFHTKMDV